MEKTACIDWLSFTATRKGDKFFPMLPPWENSEESKQETPRFGYRAAAKYPSGMVVMYDGSTATMGWHYIYSGTAIKTLDFQFEDGGNTILNWHIKQGHRCTRIDLAVDVRGDDNFPYRLAAKSEAHQWTGTAHSSTTVRGSDGRGITIYVGSRTSERFVRIYDKAAQLGMNTAWTRIEAEIKGDSARAVANAVMMFEPNGISSVGQSVICRVCEFEDRTWKEVFDGAKMPIGTPKIEEKNTEAWLLGQVASALARFERNYPERKILERLWTAVEDMLGE